MTEQKLKLKGKKEKKKEKKKKEEKKKKKTWQGLYLFYNRLLVYM
jgi:hypothetical protein